CFYEDGSPCPAAEHPIPRAIATRLPVRNFVMGVDRPVLGGRLWMLVTAQPQMAPDGGVSRVVCAFMDITQRKRAEDDLRSQKEILQKIFDNVPVMIGFVAQDGRIKLANREWERTLGWTLEEVLEQNLDVFAALYPDPKYRQEVMKFVFTSSAEFADFRTRVRDGRVIDTSWANVHLSDG